MWLDSSLRFGSVHSCGMLKRPHWSDATNFQALLAQPRNLHISQWAMHHERREIWCKFSIKTTVFTIKTGRVIAWPWTEAGSNIKSKGMQAAPFIGLHYRKGLKWGTQMIVMLQHSTNAKRCHDLTNRQISFKILGSWFWALFYAISLEKYC